MPDRRVLAAVYVDDDTGGAWLVAETPLEVRDRVEAGILAGDRFVELTLANPDDPDDTEGPRWNGRPVYVRPELVTTIGPPLDTRDRQDD